MVGELEVVIEAGGRCREAGLILTAEYVAKGGKVSAGIAPRLFRTADINHPSSFATAPTIAPAKDDLPLFHRDQVLVGFSAVHSVQSRPSRRFASKGVTSFFG